MSKPFPSSHYCSSLCSTHPSTLQPCSAHPLCNATLCNFHSPSPYVWTVLSVDATSILSTFQTSPPWTSSFSISLGNKVQSCGWRPKKCITAIGTSCTFLKPGGATRLQPHLLFLSFPHFLAFPKKSENGCEEKLRHLVFILFHILFHIYQMSEQHDQDWSVGRELQHIPLLQGIFAL